MSALTSPQPDLDVITAQVCRISAEHLGLAAEQVEPDMRLIQDLNIDSLDLVELIMELEDRFAVTIPDQAPNPVYKSVFTRPQLRLRDIAELIYLQWGSGQPERKGWTRTAPPPTAGASVPFTQLGGRLPNGTDDRHALYEPLEKSAAGLPQYRRRTDGMRCVRIPQAIATIGNPAAQALDDETPLHDVRLDEFLIDAEPVSVLAYTRFLNSINGIDTAVLRDWFVLDASDKRRCHKMIEAAESGYQPVAGTQTFPMVLVSWYGANAYSLWANGRDWRDYRDESSPLDGRFLPTEAQWEYAARGAQPRRYPWGDQPAEAHWLRTGQHRRGRQYATPQLPMAGVHEQLGMSPFGLHHMAGNVWQWCRDWYDPQFYASDEARLDNACNDTPTEVRAERGGSWVGPATLARSSYRRARPPLARGRCLGFRCVGEVE